jgi:DNA-binding FadR family transcriptional regulator
MTIRAKPRGLKDAAARNLPDFLARNIGERILAGEFAPGSLLPNEVAWGKIFKASRTAVREAIKSLAAKGLVVSRPKVGSRVEPRMRWNLLDRDVLDWHHTAIDRLAFMKSTQEARRLIEPGIAALAAKKRSPEQLRRLIDALDGMRKARNVSAMTAPDIEFHEALLAAANNDLLVPFGIIIEKALGIVFDYTTPRNPKIAHSLKLHEQIVRAIVEANEKAASDAMLALLKDTDAIIAAVHK